MTSYNYLIKKYIELNLLDGFGNKIDYKNNWDPFIYPDNGYIPPCSICKNAYDAYNEYINTENLNSSNNEIVWNHHMSGCLWSEFYQDKIKTISQNIKFVKNK
jgi:hypothetical protein